MSLVRPVVLVLSHDASLASTKTSRYLINALQRLGRNAVGRDTQIARWNINFLQDRGEVDCLEAYQLGFESKWNKLISDYGIHQIVSLDLHWLLSDELFLKNEKIQRIDSFWFDDLRSHLVSTALFPLKDKTVAQLIRDPKITHHCYGLSQKKELEQFGIEKNRFSPLAAPVEFLQEDHPCPHPHQIAFIGNPGLSTPPTAQALKAMHMGKSIAELRQLARDEILADLKKSSLAKAWMKIPGMADLLQSAMEWRLTQPHQAAIEQLIAAGQKHPATFRELNWSGHILDAAFLVKLVNRYDRPGLVYRLWKKGWLTVYGTPEQWLPYGIKAHPTISFPRLIEAYQRHAIHLNAANCSRDATANEKLFEIAACGRFSLNLESPDVRACYDEKEIGLAPSDEALEAQAEYFLQHQDEARDRGQAARARTAREHLWEHRLKGICA